VKKLFRKMVAPIICKEFLSLSRYIFVHLKTVVWLSIRTVFGTYQSVLIKSTDNWVDDTLWD
jgi:hypothetical protein